MNPFSVAILYYDYMLTASDERKKFWKTAKLSFPSILYVINRVLGVAISPIFELISIALPSLSEKVSSVFVRSMHLFIIIA